MVQDSDKWLQSKPHQEGKRRRAHYVYRFFQTDSSIIVSYTYRVIVSTFNWLRVYSQSDRVVYISHLIVCCAQKLSY